ncbi:MAG: hypothetical protein AB7N54_19585 [Alphaproteobacteria bacterium]
MTSDAKRDDREGTTPDRTPSTFRRVGDVAAEIVAKLKEQRTKEGR